MYDNVGLHTGPLMNDVGPSQLGIDTVVSDIGTSDTRFRVRISFSINNVEGLPKKFFLMFCTQLTNHCTMDAIISPNYQHWPDS